MLSVRDTDTRTLRINMKGGVPQDESHDIEVSWAISRHPPGRQGTDGGQ